MFVGRSVRCMVSALALFLGVETAEAQPYPDKPIRIVTGAVGGGSDFTSRIIAQGISGTLGQRIVVDNRPTGIVPAQIITKAAPDGYTLLVSGSNFWIGPLLQNSPYDPIKDTSPITTTDRSPDILAVHPSVGVASIKELIALARSKPGQLNYSTGQAGTTHHLQGELFKSMAGVNIVNIPYKGGGPALSALLTGEVQMAFLSPPATMPLLKTGKLRALAITSAEPSALVPDIPPIAVSLPGYEADATTAIFAPAKTPMMIINRLNQEIVRFLRTPEAKERFFSAGVEPVGTSPLEITATIKSDMVKWAKVISTAGIRLDSPR